ncbi:MAG TPA: hypothetical protein VH186_34050 [Chloroflexia bacterium]|nr:hypothetical protein [Chloroflexia bacterium]
MSIPANNNQTETALVEFVPVKLFLVGTYPDTANPIKVTGSGTKRAQPEKEGQLEVEGMLGVNTGLAFHLSTGLDNSGDNQLFFDEDGELSTPFAGYILTHVQSGRSLGSRTVETPRQARKWLELVAPLADWNRPLPRLPGTVTIPGTKSGTTGSASTTLETLEALVEEARKQAIEFCVSVSSFG